MRIAIVGAGVSGLVSAHLLRRAHEVTVFEAAPRLGGHVNTVRFDHGGRGHAVDTGFIVFNETHYPRFTRLLGELGVESQPTTMGFSVRCDETGVEYNGESIAKLFAQRRNLVRPSFLRMVGDILRFYRNAERQAKAADPALTVAAFVRRHGYGSEFVRRHLVPLGASLWSCPPGKFLEFPIRFVVEFFANHHMLQLSGRPVWRTVAGGSFRYVEALVRSFRDRIRTASPVRRVRRTEDGVLVSAGDGGPESFDEVVFACHADQALRLLERPTQREREIVGSFAFQPNETVLHTDVRLLPRARRAWASWNYHVRGNGDGAATVTYNMNILQNLRSDEVFCVTLNESEWIDPERILARTVYEHPVYRAESARGRQAEVLRHDRTSFCGAYWGWGFHEDGVRSAVAVARAFDLPETP